MLHGAVQAATGPGASATRRGAVVSEDERNRQTQTRQENELSGVAPAGEAPNETAPTPSSRKRILNKVVGEHLDRFEYRSPA